MNTNRCTTGSPLDWCIMYGMVFRTWKSFSSSRRTASLLRELWSQQLTTDIRQKKKNLTTDILNKATYLSAIQAAGKVLTYFVRFNYSLLANMSTYSNKTFSLFRSCVNDSWLRDLFSDHVIHSIRLEILLLYYVYGCAALTHICTSDLKIYQKPCHLFWLVVGSDSKPCPIT